MRLTLTTPHSDALAALLTAIAGPTGTDSATLEERLEQLPVSLALAAALYLAGAEIETAAASAATSGLQIAAHIYDRLRPLAGQDLRLDDDLARLALTLGQPEEAI